MIKRTYTDEELISELHRFVRENGRSPIALDMKSSNGYPSANAYKNHFGSFRHAFKIAKLKPNHSQYRPRLNGTETCSHCGKYAFEIVGFINWHHNKENGKIHCNKCGNAGGIFYYKKGELNKKSATGKATISEQVVKNVLNLEERYDCNFACGFGYSIDLYHKKKYKCINVKDSVLFNTSHQGPHWNFSLTQKVIPDTYIMLGYDENRKNILRVWITDAIDDLVFNEKTGKLLKTLSITNKYLSGVRGGLTRAEPWEVDAKPYNDMLHRMSDKRKETNGEKCFLSNDDLI